MIAVDECADVDHDGVTCNDRAVADLVVRASSMLWPGRDNRVVAPVVCTMTPHPIFEFVADISLCDRFIDRAEQHRFDLRKCGVSCAGCGLDPFDLSGILGFSSRCDERVDRRECEVNRQPRPHCLADGSSVEGNLARARSLDHGVLQCPTILEDHDLDATPLRFGLCPVAVARVGSKRCRSRTDDGPAIRPGEAGQPPDVGQVGEK